MNNSSFEFMTKNKILIFSATYNEVENIDDFLDKIKELDLALDVLLIDDSSPDNTWKKIQEYSKNKKNISLIIRNKKEGLDTAHKIAYEYSIKNNYDFLITLDADLSHDPKIIPKFIDELKTNTFVLGSRYIKGGKNSMKKSRFFLSYFGNKFIKFVFNADCNEFTTSYRGFNLKKLVNFSLKDINSRGYSFFMETVYQIHNRGFSIKQIPIHFADRKKGESKIPKIEIIRTLFNVLKLKFKNRF